MSLTTEGGGGDTQTAYYTHHTSKVDNSYAAVRAAHNRAGVQNLYRTLANDSTGMVFSSLSERMPWPAVMSGLLFS